MNVKRRTVEHQWPPVGATVVVSDPMSDKTWEVEVVANPRRKSGVSFITSTGECFNTPSELSRYLLKRRVASGWPLLSWDGKHD